MSKFFIPKTQISMIDYPNQISDIVYVINCNFHCEYCYNMKTLNNISKDLLLTKEGVVDYLISKELSDAVVITGGEPSLINTEDFIYIFEKIKDKKKIKIDTNGSNFEWIKSLIPYVNLWAVDIKGDENIYSRISDNKNSYDSLKKSISVLAKNNTEVIYRFVYYPLYSEPKEKFKDILSYLKNNIVEEKTSFTFEKYKDYGILKEIEIKDEKFEEWKKYILNFLKKETNEF